MILRILFCLMLLPLSALAQGSSTNAIMLDPGLASTPGTYNPGTQKAISGRRISPQIWYEAHTSSCALNSTCGSTNDSGKLLTATAANVTFSIPSPGAIGAASFMFGYDNAHPYTLATVSGTIYGCGTTGTSVTLAVQAQLISDGTNWQCVQGGIGVSVLPNNTLLGQNAGGGSQLPLTPSQVTTMLAGTSGSVFGTLSANKTDSGDNAWTNRARTPSCPLTDAGTIAVSAAGCNVRTVTLGGNRTLGDPTNALGGEWLTFFITQDTTGSRTLGYGSSYVFSNNTAPTLTTTPGHTDIISCYILTANPLVTFCPGFQPNFFFTTLPTLLSQAAAQSGGAASSISVTLSSYSGNPLIVGTLNCDGSSCAVAPTVAAVTSITTSAGNTCSHAAGSRNTGNDATDIWVCGAGTAGSNTVTVNCSGGGGCYYLLVAATEWSHFTGTCSLGNQNLVTATSDSLATSGPTTAANSIIFAVANDHAVAPTPGNTLATSGTGNVITEYQIGAASGTTYSDSITSSASGALSMSVAACN